MMVMMTSNQDRIESGSGPVSITELVDELKTLRKGRGVHRLPIAESIGPSLRAVCGIPESAGPAAARERLAEVLGAHSARLPADLRLAVTAAFALDPQVQHPFLAQRIQWLAGLIQRDDRTARRRMCDAIGRLAEQLAAEGVSRPVAAPAIGHPPSPDGWFVERFSAVVSLDQPSPEAIEHRCVVAEVDGIDRIELSVSLPRAPSDRDADRHLAAQVLYGGRLVIAERASDSRFRYVLELPTPLRAGDRHEYGVSFRVPTNQPMRPHYVHTPSRRCDLFDLRVRFPEHGIPVRAWRVMGAFLRVVDDGEPSGDPVRPDGAGDVRLVFRDLRPGFGYGVQWSVERPPDRGAADFGRG
jgi:hypothetical protein